MVSPSTIATLSTGEAHKFARTAVMRAETGLTPALTAILIPRERNVSGGSDVTLAKCSQRAGKKGGLVLVRRRTLAALEVARKQSRGLGVQDLSRVQKFDQVPSLLNATGH